MMFNIRLRLLAVAAFVTAAIAGGASRDAKAMLAQSSTTQLEGGGGGGTYTAPPPTANKIVYLHGRSMTGWPGNGLLAASSAWTHVTLGYDGSARMSDTNVRSVVKNALSTNCRSANGNQCVIICYSAGCARMLYAMDELAAAGTPVDNVVWITATASAAGGSEVAEAATKWYSKLYSKLFGGGAAIDDDLTRSAMRGTYGFIQNRAPVAMYHLAGGYKNICRRIFIFVKVCGNSQFPGGLGDGAVPPHSSCGFANSGYYPNCSSAYGAKYTNRLSQQDALYTADHTQMVGNGVVAASARLAYTSTYASPQFLPDPGDPDADLTYDDGDGHADPNTTNNTLQLPQVLGVGTNDTNVVAADTCGGATCSTYSSGGGGGGSTGGGGGTQLQMAAY